MKKIHKEIAHYLLFVLIFMGAFVFNNWLWGLFGEAFVWNESMRFIAFSGSRVFAVLTSPLDWLAALLFAGIADTLAIIKSKV